MNRALVIMRRDLGAYFSTPAAYIVMAVFLALTGFFFFSSFFLYNQANMREFFSLLPMSLALIIPALTMRLFSEEYLSGSYEMLATLPVSSWQITLGKFLAAWAMCGVMLAPTLLYAPLISAMGELDWGPVAGGYAGAMLLAGAFAALGLWMSSITKNQIVAYVGGAAACFTLAFIDKALYFVPGAIVSVVEYIGADYHFRNFARGVLDVRDVMYFVSLAAFMLMATVESLRGRR